MTDLMDIRDLQDAFIQCRVLGHAWDNSPGATVDSDLFKIATAVLALRCTRCTTERFDYIGKDMQVFQRYYRYPDKYKSIPGQGTRPNLRGEMVRRSLLVRKYQNRKNN